MHPNLQITLSFALTFGVPVAVAARELIVLRRGNPGEGWRRLPDPIPRPKPLPPCLLEALNPPPLAQPVARKRVLEHA
jgi:hypothetical protein